MKRMVGVLVCMWLLAASSYGAAVQSNGTGGGLWSAPGTWEGGVVPGNGDNVTIVSPDVVTFDVDQSGYANGIGLTIDKGAKLECSESAGSYYLKCNARLTLNGTLQAGTSVSVPLPSSVTFTVDLNGNVTISCGPSSTIALYCTEPTHPVVALSTAAIAGATNLSVDTDVSDDIWVSGSEIRIDDVSGTLPYSEIRTVAAGGITSGALTVTSGLTKTKVGGAKVILVSRNIRIINGTGYAVISPVWSHVAAEVRTASGISSGSRCTIGGTISGCATGVSSGTGHIIGGTISGCATGVSSGAGHIIGGTISGCTSGVASGAGHVIGGTISGCASGVASGAGHMVSGSINGCTTGIQYSAGHEITGVISGCTNGIYYGSGFVASGAILAGNTYDLRSITGADIFNSALAATTGNYQYNTNSVPAWSYVASYDHDQVPGAFKAWTRGGVIASDVTAAPLGYPTAFRHMCESADMQCFRQTEMTLEPGQTLQVAGKIKIADDHSAWAPRLEIIDPAADPLVDAQNSPLASNAIAVPDGSVADWQDVVVSFTNTGTLGKKVIIRSSAKRASGDVYEVWGTSVAQ